MGKMGKRSGPQSQKWIVLFSHGKSIGPFTEDAIQRLIAEGTVDESCRVRLAAGGNWIPLTQEPAFFEAVLAAVNKPKNPDRQPPQNLIAETVATAPPTRQSASMSIENNPDEMTKNPRERSSVNHTVTPLIRRPRTKKNPVLNLENLAKAIKNERKLATRVPLLLGLAALLIGLAALFIDRPPDRDQIHLIAPNFDVKPVAGLDMRSLENQLIKARSAYWSDTVEGFLEAQNQLVGLVESAPQYLPARGLLCLVYRELWPYTKQNKSDSEALDLVTKSTRRLDPSGPQGAYCDLSSMLSLGKLTEARGVVDYLLERADAERVAQIDLDSSSGKTPYRFASDPIIMSFRAELLSGTRDSVLSTTDPYQAALYVANIQKYSPQWVKMYFLQAKFLLQAGQPQEASKAFENTLKINPGHKPALIEYGIMNYMQFRQSDIALRYISGALTSRGIISRPLEARAHYTLAKILADRRELAEALDHAQKAYELNPADNQVKSLVIDLGGDVKLKKGGDSNNSLVFEGDQHAREGDCLIAQAMYKSAFETDPSNGNAAMKAAKCLKTLNRPLEAVIWLRKAIAADPKLVTPYLLMADYYSERFDFRSAEKALAEASQKFGGHYEILRGYGLVTLRQNSLKQSIGYLQQSLRGYENDIDTLILLAKAHLQLGLATNNTELLQKSLSYAARALELDRAKVEAHVVYAQALAPFKGFDSAISYLTELRAQFSRNVEYPLAIAELYRVTERYSEAINFYRNVIEWKPETKEAHLGLAECLHMTGDTLAALKSYYDAAAYDPSDPEPFLQVGIIYIESHRFTEAIAPLKKALDTNEAKPMVRFNLGKAYLGLGDAKAALDWAQKEINYYPKTADGYVLAAQIYSRMENYKACAEQYQMAVGLRDYKKQKADLFVDMARCQRQSSNLDGAQGSLDIAMSLESGNARIYREQGAVFEARGDPTSAAAAYNRYLVLNPNAPDKAEVERKLRGLGRVPAGG
ncbi:MAG: hypothetical protein C5B49_12430 [Bdellovibrio sp.]|nr:MAG: hypothetical protein C5B49_12430 [Bdellovibrio sp.]